MAKLCISIMINLIIVIWTGYTLWWFFHIYTRGQSTKQKRTVFRYYTYNSNILSAFASCLVLIFELVQFAHGMSQGASQQLSPGQIVLPDWVVLLHFTAASSVTVTMLTVCFFLAPNAGWKELFKDDGLYMHAIGPVLAILSFAFLEKGYKLSFPLSLLGASTVVVYAVIYLYQVIQKGEKAGGWPDFYGFNAKPGMWKISFPVMIAGGCAVSLLLAFLHNI